MAFVAVLGGGALGGAVAHALARRERVTEVRLIDPLGDVARGKTLDILQSSPIDGFGTRLTASDALEAAAGAAAVVLADDAASGSEHSGEAGLALVRRLAAIEATSPIVFAGAAQRELIGRAVTELRLSRTRVVGSAPYALESALRTLTAIAMDGTGTEVSLRIVGVPPRGAVVAWHESSVGGQPLSAYLPAHVISGLAARIPGLWPPGPYALGAACSRLVEALVHGSRRTFTCFVVADGGLARGAAVALPVKFERGGVREVVIPTLTPQEQTMLDNALQG